MMLYIQYICGSMFDVSLVMNLFFFTFSEIGIRVDSTNHITSILPGSVAAEEGTVAVGDRIITVRIVLTV